MFHFQYWHSVWDGALPHHLTPGDPPPIVAPPPSGHTPSLLHLQSVVHIIPSDKSAVSPAHISCVYICIILFCLCMTLLQFLLLVLWYRHVSLHHTTEVNNITWLIEKSCQHYNTQVYRLNQNWKCFGNGRQLFFKKSRNNTNLIVEQQLFICYGMGVVSFW